MTMTAEDDDGPEKKSSSSKILGYDTAVLEALWQNILSWFVRTFAPSLLPKLLPVCDQEDTTPTTATTTIRDDSRRTRCISIGRPGGMEQLRFITLKPGILTCGYNLADQDIPFTKPMLDDNNSVINIPADCVVLENQAFSVNYADCCIRWGLYESAKRHVGYPIVPGFDVAGMVGHVPPVNTCSTSGKNDNRKENEQEFQIGDAVFGCSLFGAYSSRVLIPKMQLRKIPAGLSMAQAAALPTVSLTALYALFLAGHFPVTTTCKFTNRAVLIHSAAGGVGSMLVQMSKLLGLSPIVGVVGGTAKVDAAKALGCDVVIDKSQQPSSLLWKAARAASPSGYASIFDCNGVATLSDSYEHLAMTGRLIVYGFHTNLPMGQDMLSPMEWIRMGLRMNGMPKFDAMAMGQDNKAVLAFNLSFFAQEREMLSHLFDQVCEWLEQGKLACPRVVEFSGMEQIAQAHELIQSGKSVGKIVLHTSPPHQD
jgi:synaptic vesicle membrane protein VAT-1